MRDGKPLSSQETDQLCIQKRSFKQQMQIDQNENKDRMVRELAEIQQRKTTTTTCIQAALYLEGITFSHLMQLNGIIIK